MNEILFFISLVVAFTAIVATAKCFGEHGLITWIAVATVMANVLVPKQIDLFGLNVTMGNIMFASTYLCTDILSELYSIEKSKKAVQIGLLSALLYVAVTQVAILFHANELDFISGSMEALFSISARVTIASVTMFFLANLADVYLFAALKRKFPNALWLRNNVSTIVCNCTENFLFTTSALYGVYSLHDCISIAAATCVVEVIIAVCDTPFLYWTKRICRR